MSEYFDRIQFERTDWAIAPEMELAAKAFAEFLFLHPDKLGSAREVMRNIVSRRKASVDWVSPFRQWRVLFCRKERIDPNAADYRIFFNLSESCFKACHTVESFEKMCGLVPELYAELCYEKRYENVSPKALGFGCKVVIDEKEIVYRPAISMENPATHDCDKVCVSVDIAAWDGRFSDYVEIKISPDAFQTKNIGYMRNLREELNNKQFKHFIRLYTWGDKDLLVERLNVLGVAETEFLLLIGKELLDVPSVEQLVASF